MFPVRSLFVASFSACVAFAMNACTVDEGESRVPALDEASFPAAATFASDATYTLRGFVSFRGASPIQHVRIHYASGVETTAPVPASTAGVSVPVTIKFDGRTPRGSQDVAISIVDAAGHESAPANVRVDLY